jgi:hypothetical protein
LFARSSGASSALKGLLLMVIKISFEESGIVSVEDKLLEEILVLDIFF